MNEPMSLSQLADVDIEAVDKAALVDAGGLGLDDTIPQAQRAAWLIQAIKNPYCFRVGDVGVKLAFSEDAPALQAVFTDFLIRKKSGLSP